MSTPHNQAMPGEIAKTVLMPGDPLRAKYIAEHYLEDAVCFNEVRGMLGYTGTYRGVRVSVMGSGMGMPSMGIYSHELYQHYGVEQILRIGSAGGISPRLRLGDVLVSMGASTDSSFARQFCLPGDFAPLADYELLSHTVEKAKELGFSVQVGNTLSSDAFYQDNPNTTALWSKMGVLAVEMETAALYCNAARFGKRAVALFTVSDHLLTGEELPPKVRQEGFDRMIRLALEAAITFAPQEGDHGENV